MTLLEATSTLLDCVKTWSPNNSPQVNRAVRRMERRLQVLQLRQAKSLRRRRQKGWLDLQHLAPACQHCGFDFCFGDFAKTAELNWRGDIIRFDCPSCEKLVVMLWIDGDSKTYVIWDEKSRQMFPKALDQLTEREAAAQ
jgi:hypothetical protein